MRTATIPEFRLRFPLGDVRHWADRYAYADDSEVEAIGEVAGKHGWYTRDQFLYGRGAEGARCALPGRRESEWGRTRRHDD